MSVLFSSEQNPRLSFADGQENPFTQYGQSHFFVSTDNIKKFIESGFDLDSFLIALSDICSLPKAEIAKVIKACSNKIDSSERLLKTNRFILKLAERAASTFSIKGNFNIRKRKKLDGIIEDLSL